MGPIPVAEPHEDEVRPADQHQQAERRGGPRRDPRLGPPPRRTLAPCFRRWEALVLPSRSAGQALVAAAGAALDGQVAPAGTRCSTRPAGAPRAGRRQRRRPRGRPEPRGRRRARGRRRPRPGPATRPSPVERRHAVRRHPEPQREQGRRTACPRRARAARARSSRSMHERVAVPGSFGWPDPSTRSSVPESTTIPPSSWAFTCRSVQGENRAVRSRGTRNEEAEQLGQASISVSSRRKPSRSSRRSANAWSSCRRRRPAPPGVDVAVLTTRDLELDGLVREPSGGATKLRTRTGPARRTGRRRTGPGLPGVRQARLAEPERPLGFERSVFLVQSRSQAEVEQDHQAPCADGRSASCWSSTVQVAVHADGRCLPPACPRCRRSPRLPTRAAAIAGRLARSCGAERCRRWSATGGRSLVLPRPGRG